MSTQAAEKQEIITTAPADQTTSFIQMIERAASNPNVDVDKMSRLLDMQERVLNKQAETDFAQAMASAQSEIGRVAADASNPQTRSKYASYAALDRAIRPAYAKHGFALSFDTADTDKDGYVRVVCHVSHRGGHTRTYHIDMPADGKGAKGGDVMTKTHATGSAMTYGQRYLLKSIFNIAIGTDDDGNGAEGSPLIDDARKDEIVGLLKETESDVQKFLQYMGVESVDEITVRDVGRALNMLNAKKEATRGKR